MFRKKRDRQDAESKSDASDGSVNDAPNGEDDPTGSSVNVTSTRTLRYPTKPRKKIPTGKFERGSAWRGLRWLAFLVLSGFALIVGFAVYYSGDLPSIARLEVYEPKLSTKVYSIDGKLIKEFYRERRTRVPFDEIPADVKNALLATEDHRFYDHWGVDLIRFVKAAMVNVSSLSARQGFSSLTQQLARNLYFDPEKTLARKFKEVLTAIQIERTYSKNEIIEMYLTHMYFGREAFGIQAASKIFFNKDVDELTLPEAAFLIGHLQAPSYYAANLDAANRRKNIVLMRMRECEFISAARYDSARSVRVIPSERQEEVSLGTAPYFTESVRQRLEQLKDSLNINIYEDGLGVYTTLDTRAQQVAERAYEQSVKEKLAGLDKFGARVIRDNLKPYLTRYLIRDGVDRARIDELLADPQSADSLCRFYGAVQAAFVAMDPSNGHILAMIGGRDFRRYKLNHVTQAARQPGSTFKPFLYTVAIDNGYSPVFKILNQDVVLMMEDGSRWTPQNYDGSRGGPTTLRDAIARSLNLVAVRLMQEIVPAAQVVSYARKMGLSTPMPPVDALALGVADVIPLEMVSAYSIFANKGIRVEPVAILRIEDKDGNVIWQHVPKRKEVLSAETAFIMTDMMKSSIDEGTGRYARKFGFDRPAAVKTGTTQKWSDGWYLGFTPQIVAGVWVGFDTYEFNLGSKNPGEVVAAPLWGRFMAEAHQVLDLPVEDFEMPPGVVRLEVCKESGLLANNACPVKINEVFSIKYQPTENCDLHTGRPRPGKKKGRY
jgi:penicillin-binding protein 1A